MEGWGCQGAQLSSFPSVGSSGPLAAREGRVAASSPRKAEEVEAQSPPPFGKP